MKKRRLLNLFFIIPFLFGIIFVMSCKDDEKITEIELKPKIDFNTSPTSPMLGNEVTFSGKKLAGSSNIVSWSWNFGVDANSTADTQEATYTYSEIGKYNVKLSVTDENGNNETVTKEISVSELPDVDFPAKIAWSFSTGVDLENGNNGTSAPVIDNDGRIFYIEGEGAIISVTDKGDSAEKNWVTPFPNGVRGQGAPSIGPDGNIYHAVWSADAITKFDANTGSILWAAHTNTGISNSTAAIDKEGNIYIGSRAEGVFSFSQDGTLRWQHEAGVGRSRPYYSSPAISKDGKTVYILMTGGELHALHTGTGESKWSDPVPVTSGLGSSLSIDGDGTVYLTTDFDVFAVTDNGETGSIKWNYEIAGANESGVVIGPDGVLYTGTKDGLLSLNPTDGSKLWLYDSWIEDCVPAVDKNGNVYFGSVDGRFHILDKEGKKLAEFELGDNLVNSPTIADDGTVFVEALDDFKMKLYKITVKDSAPAASAWPMKGQNRMNTGYAK